MKSKILGLLAVGLLAAPMQQASAVTVTTSRPLFNAYNVTSMMPYDILQVSWTVTNFSAADGFAVDIFSDAEGTQLSATFPFLTTGFQSTNPDSLDGLFSYRIRATAGSFDVNDVCMRIGYVTGACNADPIASVPESGTLELLGLGLAGLGLSRRRKAA